MLLVTLSGPQVAVCGLTGDEPQIWNDLPPDTVERMCREALEQPDRHAAARALRDAFPAVESPISGVRNEGFLATHALRVALRDEEKVAEAREKALSIAGTRGASLFEALGYTLEDHDKVTSILRAADRRAALAVLLHPDESPETLADRFSRMSPVSYALSVADRENLPYVLMHHGSKLRIYPVRQGIGVGRRGRTETWLECHLGLLKPSEIASLWLVFSASALAQGGSLQELIDSSDRFAGDMATSLRERIYQRVVPLLAEGIVKSRRLRRPSAETLVETYGMAMVLLFRMLFIAYAEDKDLLPYRWNDLYRRRSLKTKALEILEQTRAGVRFDQSASLWEELRQLFLAVDGGRREWGVPPYDGGLFSEDPEESAAGAALKELSLPNSVLGPALADVLLVETPDGQIGPTDFRSLSVAEFGTIYEGLLESELSVAETDLTIDDDNLWRPCRRDETPAVRAGQVYLHNSSGARKSTGTYFTKSFAVEHLLDRSLEPALQEHLRGLDSISPEEASRQILSFRVADLAMGSGHFLVAAIDRLERAITRYLAERPLPGVAKTVDQLRKHAEKALGPLADQVDIEDSQLLRRLIARRCIYGVDINPVAVQLARLAVWIHTFVPGLPLSILDHNLACGDSLVGVATVPEAKDQIEKAGLPLFPLDADHLLGSARGALNRFVAALDDSPAEIRGARIALREAGKLTKPAEALLDIVAGARMAGEDVPDSVARLTDLTADLVDSREHLRLRRAIEPLRPFHFPVAFPEVFLSNEPGFDVIVGNPPWQEATLEEDAFWARHSPGLRGLTQREQETTKARLRKSRPDLLSVYERELAQAEVTRKALTTGPFPGMGTGDPDLYKAFCWRFWHLVKGGTGRVGVVLPRSALSAKGSTEFRQTLLGEG
ncbi:MAG: hypothetical protein IT186_27090, partial [Acidobacteria bacterium]|nr:hypothetical protein [Acidobacteriota bacterium]